MKALVFTAVAAIFAFPAYAENNETFMAYIELVKSQNGGANQVCISDLDSEQPSWCYPASPGERMSELEDENAPELMLASWKNCQPFATGTICEIHGSKKGGWNMYEWDQWRTRNWERWAKKNPEAAAKPYTGPDLWDFGPSARQYYNGQRL